MGLDTVDLIVEIENKFGIIMTDDEAIRTLTVGDIANLVYLKKEISLENKDIFREVYFKLKEVFIELGIKEEIISVNTELIEMIPIEKRYEYQKYIEKVLELRLPKFSILKYSSIEEEGLYILGYKIYKRNKQVRSYVLSQFIDYIVSLNYEKLIDLNNIKTKYEVERVICMIINDRCGININEIELHYRIVSDLGIQ